MQKKILITFSGLPTNIALDLVLEAITLGISYYGTVIQWNTEKLDFLPQFFVPTTIHALLNPSLKMREKSVQIPLFI